MTTRIPQKILRMPYIRIGGRHIHPPLILTHVQTDGSYGSFVGPRITAIVKPATARHTFRYVKNITAESPTETEWASIALGLEAAIQLDQTAINIDNDNLGVIGGLLNRDNYLRKEYARYWRSIILNLSAKTDWTGVRWIPRRDNRADDIFRY
jgi:hypothetical protein